MFVQRKAKDKQLADASDIGSKGLTLWMIITLLKSLILYLELQIKKKKIDLCDCQKIMLASVGNAEECLG